MKLVVGAFLVSVVAASPVAAKPPHWHDGNGHGNKHARASEAYDARDYGEADCRFGPRDVRIIREYYEPRSRSLPPGLAKKYYRTGHLPPGWQKKLQPLPVFVERRLSPLPRGYERGVIDGAVIVYAPHTQIVVDVITVR